MKTPDPAPGMNARPETRAACSLASGTLGRRALFGASLVVVGAVSVAESAAAEFSDLHHDANDPLPLSAKATDELPLPGRVASRAGLVRSGCARPRLG